jgi:hypothetical protein
MVRVVLWAADWSWLVLGGWVGGWWVGRTSGVYVRTDRRKQVRGGWEVGRWEARGSAAPLPSASGIVGRAFCFWQPTPARLRAQATRTGGYLVGWCVCVCVWTSGFAIGVLIFVTFLDVGTKFPCGRAGCNGGIRHCFPMNSAP